MPDNMTFNNNNDPLGGIIYKLANGGYSWDPNSGGTAGTLDWTGQFHPIGESYPAGPTSLPSPTGPGSNFSVNPSGGGGNVGSDINATSQLYGSDYGSGGSANTSFLNSPTGQALLKFALSYGANKALGGKTTEEKQLSQYSTAPYNSSQIQGFLPRPLQSNITDPMVSFGLLNIANLLQNPGSLSPGVSQAIQPRLAAESQNIAQNYRGIGSNMAGAAARSNLPVSIQTALQSALDTQQERAQRQSRQAALSESGQLQREDVGQTYKLLDTLLQFTSSGRGQAIPGLTAAANQSGQRQASNMALVGDLLNSVFKE